MPRRHAASATAAQPEVVREETRPTRRRRTGGTQPWESRLSKRTVQKLDGRYLIYYDKA